MKKRLIAISLLSVLLVGVWTAVAVAATPATINFRVGDTIETKSTAPSKTMYVVIGKNNSLKTMVEGRKNATPFAGEAAVWMIMSDDLGDKAAAKSNNLTTGWENSKTYKGITVKADKTTSVASCDILITGKPEGSKGDKINFYIVPSAKTPKATLTLELINESDIKAPTFNQTPAQAKEKFGDLVYNTAPAFDTEANAITLSVTSYADMKKWEVTGLPTGLETNAKDNTTETLKIWGTPKVAVKNQKVTVSARNAKGTTTLNFNLDVTHDGDVAWGTPTAVTGASYEADALKGNHKVKQYVNSKVLAAETGEPASASTGNDYVLRAVPGPIKWTVKDLPAGITYKTSGDTDLVLKGKYTTAHELDPSTGLPKKNFKITAENKVVGGETTLTLDGNADDVKFIVWDKPQITTTSLPAITVDKEWKAPIAFKNFPTGEDGAIATNGTLKVEIDDKVTTTAVDIVATADGFEPKFTVFGEEKSSTSAAGITAETAAKITWDSDKKQLVGLLDQASKDQVINVKVSIGNPATGTAVANLVTKTFKNVKIMPAAPSLGTPSSTVFEEGESGYDPINVDVSKGTKPVIMTAYIDKNTVTSMLKPYDSTAGSAQIDLGSETNVLGLTFAAATGEDESGYNLTIDPTGKNITSFKGLPVTISLVNAATGKNPVTKQIKLDLNASIAPEWVQGGAEVDKDLVGEDALAEVLDTPLTGREFTISGDKAKPWKVTSPKNGATTNGIKATWDNKDNPTTVTFSGKPTKIGDTKFTLTVENPLSKKKTTRNIAFRVGYGDNNPTVKPVIEDISTTELATGTAASATVSISDGVPLLEAGGMVVYIPKASANSVFGVNKDVYLWHSDSNKIVADDNKSGLTATYEDGSISDGVTTPGELKFEYEANDTYPAWKGLSVVVEARNSVTEAASGKKPVTKTFKLNANADVFDAEPSWYKGTEKVAANLVSDAIVIETQDAKTIEDAALTNADTKIAASRPIAAGTELPSTVTDALKFYADLPTNGDFSITANGTALTKTTNGVTTAATKNTKEVNGLVITAGTDDPRAITITGTPTAKKDTTSKITLVATNNRNKKKSTMTVTVSAYAAPEFTNVSELETKPKEFEVGKKVSIKPKVKVNKNLPLQYVVTADDKKVLTNLGLELNAETGEIAGDADEVYPTLDSTNAKYEANDVTLYVVGSGYASSSAEEAFASQKVSIKIKPKTPKIKTTKYVWDRTTGADNPGIEISNITNEEVTVRTADSATGVQAAAMAKLTWTYDTPFTTIGFTGLASDLTDTDDKVSGVLVGTPSKQTKPTQVKITVDNYGIKATQTVSFTINDPQPVITAFTVPNITASKTEAVKKEVTLNVTSWTGDTKDTSAFKWKINTRPEGVTAKITPSTKTAGEATLVIEAKKNMKGDTIDTSVGVIVTNTQSKQDSEEVEVAFTVTPVPDEDTALPETDTALPTENDVALPVETTTSIAGDEVESALPEDRLLGEGEVHIGRERKADSMRDSEKAALSQAGYVVAAILPEITVTADGQYDLVVSIDEKVEAGRELVWFAFPRDVEPSEDDEIVDFYDITGQDTEVVPENHELIVSPWFEAEIVYAPVIAVKAEAGDKATDEKGLKDATEAEDKDVAEVEILESDDEPVEDSDEVEMELLAE